MEKKKYRVTLSIRSLGDLSPKEIGDILWAAISAKVDSNREDPGLTSSFATSIEEKGADDGTVRPLYRQTCAAFGDVLIQKHSDSDLWDVWRVDSKDALATNMTYHEAVILAQEIDCSSDGSSD